MISRVADNCFWFGRYVERAESTARLLGVTRELVFDAELTAAQCWQPLIIVSGEYPVFLEKNGPEAAGNGELVQDYITWSPENGVSLANSVRAAREIARTIRDVLSLEVWEEVNQLYLWINDEAAQQTYAGPREEFYRRVRRGTQLTLGLVRSSMLHDDPMRFLWLGVLLERVGQIARILDMHHHTLSAEIPQSPAPPPPAKGERAATQQVVELGLWLSLLRACSGFEAFMKRHRGRVSRSTLASFLIFEPQFPRSLRYCLRSALQVMRQIWPKAAEPNAGPHEAGSRSIASLEALCSWLDAREPGLQSLSIHELLTGVVDRTSVVCSTLQQEMLGPPAKPRVSAQMQAQE